MSTKACPGSPWKTRRKLVETSATQNFSPKQKIVDRSVKWQRNPIMSV